MGATVVIVILGWRNTRDNTNDKVISNTAHPEGEFFFGRGGCRGCWLRSLAVLTALAALLKPRRPAPRSPPGLTNRRPRRPRRVGRPARGNRGVFRRGRRLAGQPLLQGAMPNLLARDSGVYQREQLRREVTDRRLGRVESCREGLAFRPQCLQPGGVDRFHNEALLYVTLSKNNSKFRYL